MGGRGSPSGCRMPALIVSPRQCAVQPAQQAVAGALDGRLAERLGGDAGAAGLRTAGARRQVLVGWLVAEFRHQVVATALPHELRDVRLRIAEIAEMPRSDRTGGDAGRHTLRLLQLVVVDAIDA